MKKFQLLCSLMLIICLSAHSQSFNDNLSTTSQADNVTAEVNVTKERSVATSPRMVQISISLQNTSSCNGVFQIVFSPRTSGGTYQTVNFTSSGQNVNIEEGLYDVSMRGPNGYTYKFSYYTCASSGTAPGPVATFSNVNICANGSFMVIN